MADVLEIARRVLRIEAEELGKLTARIGPSFSQTIDLILKTPGKVITTGIGKSGLIAAKISSTFNSIGIQSAFLHPVEALHGDLGIVNQGDVVLAISHSGYSNELVELVPLLKQCGAKVVGMTGGLDSSLAEVADIVLDCGVDHEACPLDLVPTASTTAALAMGDALAVASMELRAFAPEDFRRSHPGGKLGQRLSLKISQVMLRGDRIPLVSPATGLTEAIAIMDVKDLGTILVADAQNRLLGIFTDGDLRRLYLQAGSSWRDKTMNDLMIKNPRSVGPDTLAAEVLHIMEELQITALAIVDESNVILGVIHLHDLLGRGKISFGGGAS